MVLFRITFYFFYIFIHIFNFYIFIYIFVVDDDICFNLRFQFRKTFYFFTCFLHFFIYIFNFYIFIYFLQGTVTYFLFKILVSNNFFFFDHSVKMFYFGPLILKLFYVTTKLNFTVYTSVIRHAYRQVELDETLRRRV